MIFYVKAKPCGSRCTEAGTSFYIFSFERQGLDIPFRLPYAAFFEALWMFGWMIWKIPSAALPVIWIGHEKNKTTCRSVAGGAMKAVES